jgi:hypothetical protein
MNKLGVYILGAGMLLACGGDHSSSGVSSTTSSETPREKTKTAQKPPTPAQLFELYLNKFQFYNGQRASQFEAHHYCSTLSEDLTQCVIFDGSGTNAKLMGVEYVISERLFKTLPDDEKKLWHSYRYNVKSGILVAPDLSPKAEHNLMNTLVTRYGKTWQLWHTDQDSTLPFGGPALLMDFTRDGQLDPGLLQTRDKRLNISSAEKRQLRSDILGRPPVSGADSWQNGPGIQLPALTRRNHPHLQKDTLR